MVRQISIFVFFSFFLFSVVPASGQISAGDDKQICSGETVWLAATVEETFATHIVFGDDTVAGPYPIGFEFEFYGEEYTEFYISDNGWISFSLPSPNNNSWNGGQSPRVLPDDSDFVPKNCIMGAWQDWSPAFSGRVGYELKGTKPQRKMIVSYCQVAAYHCFEMTGTFQIVLYEGSNYIDVNLNTKPYCPAWYDGKAVLGIHNIDGTEACVAEDRNATQWTASEESWRFKPSEDSYDLVQLSNYIPVLSGTLSPVAWYFDDVAPENYIGTADSIRVSPSNTTVYVASVTLCGDMVFKDDVEVTVRPLPIADAGRDTTIFAKTQAYLDGSASQCLNGGCTYSWTPVDKIDDDPYLKKPTTIPLSFTTAYYLTLEDQYGCMSDSDRVVVNVINGPLSILTIADPAAICRGESVTITAIGGGGQRPYYYAWSSEPTGTNSSDSSIVVSPEDTTKYYITLTADDGETVSDSIVVEVLNPEPLVTGQNIVCENENDILYSSPIHGENTYSWSVEGGSIINSNTDNIVYVTWRNSGTGKVTLQETLPPPHSCVSFATMEVQILERPKPLVTGREIVCENEKSVVYSTDEFSDRDYNWIADGGVINGATPYLSQISIDWGAAGEGRVSVTEQLTIHPACKSSRTLDVSILPGPHPQISGPQEACAGDSEITYTANAETGITNRWGTLSNGRITGSTDPNNVYVTWDIAGKGNLFLEQTVNYSGCSAVSDTFRVEIHPRPVLSISPENLSVCEFEEVELEVSGSDTLLWYPSDGLLSNDEKIISFIANEDIVYHVIGTNGYGCKDTTEAAVSVTPVPVVDLGGDRYIRENESVVLTAGSGGDYYQWQDGSTGVQFTAYSGGEYYVTVEKNGCFAADTVVISPTMGAIPIPSAFTPNNDGLNDVFCLFGQLDKVAQFSMRIFARNGQLVYSSNDVYEGWNGDDLNGNPLPAGTYIYSVELLEQGDPFGQGIIVKKGTVTLLR